MISIGYSITLQLKKDMSCLLNVCTYVQALKKSLSPLPHPPTSFYMKPSIMHTFKVGFSWVISVSWEKGTHPSEDFFCSYILSKVSSKFYRKCSVHTCAM